MAMSSSRISALAGSGLAAAAAARPATGGRGIASAAQSPVEQSSFSQQIGFNDNIVYDDQGNLDADGRRRQTPQGTTPFVARAASGYHLGETDDSDDGNGSSFLTDVMHGIGVYEENARIVSPGAVHAGAVLNRLY